MNASSPLCRAIEGELSEGCAKARKPTVSVDDRDTEDRTVIKKKDLTKELVQKKCTNKFYRLQQFPVVSQYH